MNKCYYRIIWKNYPDDGTPINEQNLNKVDVAADEMDNRIISLDSTKFDKSEAQLLVKYIEYDEDTGIFKITHYNGASYTIDTLLEKLAINFDYDYQNQRLIITLSDGEVKYVDLSALITQYEFLNSDTVHFTISADGKVKAEVKEGSIQEKHLRPDYLADIRVESAKAAASAVEAGKSEASAAASQAESKKSEDAAKESEKSAAASAGESADSAAASLDEAAKAAASAAAAKDSQDAAKISETNAEASQDAAEASKTAAAGSAGDAEQSAENAAGFATEAESFAHGGTGTREGEDTDNAKEYYKQAKAASERLSGTIHDMGTVAFADLPDISIAETGDMYNISNEFITDSTFKDGIGLAIPAGSNVYKTIDGYWDVLSGVRAFCDNAHLPQGNATKNEDIEGPLWYLAATVTVSRPFTDANAVFLVTEAFGSPNMGAPVEGVLAVRLRLERMGTWKYFAELRWEYASSNVNLNDYVLAVRFNEEGHIIANLYIRLETLASSRVLTLLMEGNITGGRHMSTANGKWVVENGKIDNTIGPVLPSTDEGWTYHYSILNTLKNPATMRRYHLMYDGNNIPVWYKIAECKLTRAWDTTNALLAVHLISGTSFYGILEVSIAAGSSVSSVSWLNIEWIYQSCSLGGKTWANTKNYFLKTYLNGDQRIVELWIKQPSRNVDLIVEVIGEYDEYGTLHDSKVLPARWSWAEPLAGTSTAISQTTDPTTDGNIIKYSNIDAYPINNPARRIWIQTSTTATAGFPADLNDLKENGRWYIVYDSSGATTPANMPPGCADGFLEVFLQYDGPYMKQVFYRSGTIHKTDFEIWYRSGYSNQGWTEWHKVGSQISILDTEIDLDDLKQVGSYYLKMATKCPPAVLVEHTRTSMPSFVTVIGNQAQGILFQTWSSSGSFAIMNNNEEFQFEPDEVWCRSLAGGTWTDWKPLGNKSLYIQPDTNLDNLTNKEGVWYVGSNNEGRPAEALNGWVQTFTRNLVYGDKLKAAVQIFYDLGGMNYAGELGYPDRTGGIYKRVWTSKNGWSKWSRMIDSLYGGQIDAPLTVTGSLKAAGCMFATSGAAGWIDCIRIKITSTNASFPLMFVINGRAMADPIILWVVFDAPSTPTLDPGLYRAQQYLGNWEFKIKKTTTSTWDIYWKKTNNYAGITVSAYYCAASNYFEVSYPNTQVASDPGGTLFDIRGNSYSLKEYSSNRYMLSDYSAPGLGSSDWLWMTVWKDNGNGTVSLRAADPATLYDKIKKIRVKSSPMSWFGGMNLDNVPISMDTNMTSGSYHPILGLKGTNGNVFNIGGYSDANADEFKINWYKSGRTTNGYDGVIGWSIKKNDSPKIVLGDPSNNNFIIVQIANANLYLNHNRNIQWLDSSSIQVSTMYYGSLGFTIISKLNMELYVGSSHSLRIRETSGSYRPILASAFTVSSSKKLKENASPMSADLARKLLLYDVLEYDYINGEKKCYGMYAENVEDYYPYAVIRTTDTKEIENEDGTKEIIEEEQLGLDYSRFVPQIIKMIQLQQEEIDTLKNEVGELRRENESLKQRLENLESWMEEIFARLA